MPKRYDVHPGVKMYENKGGQSSQEYLSLAPAYVEKMFAGPKAGLLPIYEELLKRARSLGRDIRVCPCQTIVPVYRKHVIAQIKPTTRTRIDFGLSLKGQKPPARLIETGGAAKGDRITHRVPLSSLAEIDDQVMRWLRRAYDLDV